MSKMKLDSPSALLNVETRVTSDGLRYRPEMRCYHGLLFWKWWGAWRPLYDGAMIFPVTFVTYDQAKDFADRWVREEIARIRGWQPCAVIIKEGPVVKGGVNSNPTTPPPPPPSPQGGTGEVVPVPNFSDETKERLRALGPPPCPPNRGFGVHGETKESKQLNAEWEQKSKEWRETFARLTEGK